MNAQWPYVIAAYVVAGAIILAMIVSVAGDYLAIGRRLSEMEARSARRRSGS